MSSRNFAAIDSLDTLKALVQKLQADGQPIGFDIETGYYGPNVDKGALFVDWDQQFTCGFSITNDPTWARYVPLAHDHDTNLPEADAWEIVKPLLETMPVVCHNAKFEMRNLRALERKGRGPNINLNVSADSALQSYVWSQFQWHGLKYLTKEIFGYDQAHISTLFPDVAKKHLKALRFNVLQLNQEVIDYACDDAVWTLALDRWFAPKIASSSGRKFIYDLEMRVMPMVADMEDGGHAVDWEELNMALAFAEPFKAQMIESTRKLFAQMGEGIGVQLDTTNLNLNSAPQMRKLLYEDLGLEVTRMTKGSDKNPPQPSTDKIALEGLSRKHIPVKKLVEVKQVGNLAGRLKKWSSEYSIAYDARVHASFNQVAGGDFGGDNEGAAIGSGRFSANDPAIQQLPKRWCWTTLPNPDVNNKEHMAVLREKTEFGKHYWEGNFRDFMVAGPGCSLLGFDYSQIELRALAGLSGEPSLLAAFNEGRDIHTETASMMLGIPADQVTSKERGKGKTINFGIVYGMGAQLLAEQLAISEAEAQALLDQYKSAFTKVDGWMKEQKNRGLSLGFVETYYGRKVTLWDLQSPNRQVRSKGERLCINAPVQGTAADIMKIAMVRARNALIERGWWMTKVRVVNNIHDALLFEFDNDINPAELRALLEPQVVLDINGFPKIVVDWEIGKKWGSNKKWEDETPVFDEAAGHWTLAEETELGASADSVSEDELDALAEAEEALENSFMAVVNEQAAAVAPPEPELLIVEVTDMPSKEQFDTFLAFMQAHEGTNVVTFKTPDGEVELTNFPTGITMEHAGRVSLLLGGASVRQKINATTDELSEGLEL
jgi:DNA polymerase-1